MCALLSSEVLQAVAVKGLTKITKEENRIVIDSAQNYY